MNKKTKILVCSVCFIFVIVIYYIVCFKGFWYGDYKYKLSPFFYGVEIREYRGTGDYVEIPTHLGPFKATYINNFMYKDNANVIRVFVPKGLIHPVEFTNCANLEEITFEEGTEKLFAECYCCKKLREVNIPEGVKEVMPFSTAPDLLNVVIPKSVTRVGYSAFSWTGFEKNHMNDKYYVAGDDVLIFCNVDNDEILVIPGGVKHVFYTEFEAKIPHYKEIYYPESVVDGRFDIDENATAYFGNEEIDAKSSVGKYNLMKGTIVAPAGSPMEKFCKENNLKFRAMTEEEEAVWREKTEAAASEITYQEEN